MVDRQNVSTLIGVGYSGKGRGLNNPDAEAEIGNGPIPRGVWRIRSPVNHIRLGPVSIPLSPQGPGHGRSGFYIHGDNRLGNRSASSGCIILPRHTRERIVGSGIRTLIVILG